MTSDAAILYGTSGCHLCEHADALLHDLQRQGHALRWAYTDISGDDALFARYGLRIPVLRLSSGEELDWPFDGSQVLAALRRQASTE